MYIEYPVQAVIGRRPVLSTARSSYISREYIEEYVIATHAVWYHVPASCWLVLSYALTYTYIQYYLSCNNARLATFL